MSRKDDPSNTRRVFDKQRRPVDRMMHDAPQYMPDLERIAWAVGYNRAVRDLLVEPFIVGLTGPRDIRSATA